MCFLVVLPLFPMDPQLGNVTHAAGLQGLETYNMRQVWDDVQRKKIPECLHTILTHPMLPSEHELLILFPEAIRPTITIAPTSLELQQHRSQRSLDRNLHSQLPTVYVGYSIKPTILINLALLVNVEQWSQAACDLCIPAMPGVQHICSLRPYFRVGVFCDWQEVPARAATSCLNRALHAVLHPSPSERVSAAQV